MNDDFEFNQGNEKAEEGKKKFHVDENGMHFSWSKEEDKKEKRRLFHGKTRKALNTFPFPVLALIAILLLGFVGGAWDWCWLLLLLIPVYYTLVNGTMRSFLYGSYPIFCLIAFLLLGVLADKWHPGWLVFVSIPVFYAIVDAISSRRFSGIYSAICVIAYLATGFAFNWWHPGWILFLTIPIVEWIFKTATGKKNI